MSLTDSASIIVQKHGRDVTIDGVAAKMMIAKATRDSTVPFSLEHLREGLTFSAVSSGSMVVEGARSYLVETVYEGEDGNRLQMLKCNQTVSIQRLAQTYDAYGNLTGTTWTAVASSIKAVAEYITAALRMEDAGLLPDAVYRVYLQASVDVRSPADSSLLGPDRMVFGGRNYQVEVVDSVRLPGLLVCQVGYDTRP